jgi:hypothetical protein
MTPHTAGQPNPKPKNTKTLNENVPTQPRRAFPTHALPSVFWEMANQVEAYAKCGPELPAISLIGVANAAIGPGLFVHNSRNGDKTQSNLYFLCAAEPGSGKSRVMKPILEPLLAFQSAFKATWNSEKRPKLFARFQELELELKRMDKEAMKKPKPGQPPVEDDEEGQEGGQDYGVHFSPTSSAGVSDRRSEILKELAMLKPQMIAPRMMVKDISVQSMGVFLQNHQGRAIAIDPDAREPVSNVLGKMNGGKADEGIYLGAFYGEPYVCDRITRGEVTVDNTWISILWLVQNDKFEELLKNRNILRGGFLSRFLFCEVDAPPSSRVGGVGINPDKANLYAATLTRIISAFYHADTPKAVELSGDAADVLAAYHDRYLAKYNSGDKALWIFENRYAELATRLALTLHVMRYTDGATSFAISRETVEAAIEIIEWFAEVRVSLFDLIQFGEEEEVILKIVEMCKVRAQGITLREAYRARLAGNGKKSDNLKLLERLMDQGVLVREVDLENVERYKMARK